MLHLPVHLNTRPHLSCVDCIYRHSLQCFQRLKISCRLKSANVSLYSDCICTESNLHISCTELYTGSVSIFTVNVHLANVGILNICSCQTVPTVSNFLAYDTSKKGLAMRDHRIASYNEYTTTIMNITNVVATALAISILI